MYYIDNSNIHGKGIFLDRTINKNEPIDIGIDYSFYFLPYVTPKFGSYINHSSNANTYLKFINGKYYVVSNKTIPKNTEITLNYNDTPWYIAKPDPKWE